MKNTHTNPMHLNDTELDICECDDTMCYCAGLCGEPATVTMYEVDERGNNTEVTARMCIDCSFTAYEAGTHQSDDDADDKAISAHVSKLEKDMSDNIRDTDPERN